MRENPPKPSSTIDSAAAEPPRETRSLARSVYSAPLAPPALGLIAGILLEASGYAAPSLLSLPVAFSAAYLLPLCFKAFRSDPRKRNHWHVIGLLAVFFVAAAAGARLHASAHRDRPVARFAREGSALVRVRGVVTAGARIIPRSDAALARFSFHTDRSVMTVELDRMESASGWIDASGKVRVTVREVVLDVLAGDHVEILGFVRPLRGPQNPGAFDWASYLRRRGVHAEILCANRGQVRVLRRSERGSSSTGFRGALAERARALVLPGIADAEQDKGKLIEALILGQRSRAGRFLSESFARAGASHFLAVSGMHVGILGAFVWFLSRALGLRQARAAILVMLLTIAYALLAEPRPPVLRATVMTIIFCFGLAVRRRPAAINSLSAAAIALLIWQPLDLFDVGFQLSFVAVLGILLIGVPAATLLSPSDLPSRSRSAKRRTRALTRRLPRFSRRIARWITSALLVSVAAWASTLPIALATFHEWHPFAPLVALVLMPLVAAFLAAGLIALTIGPIAPPIASACAWFLGQTESGLLQLVDALGAIPGATVVAGEPPAAWTTIYFLALAGTALGLRAWLQPSRASDPAVAIGLERRHPRAAAALTSISLAAIPAASLAWHFDERNDEVRATFLAVGDGSAAVLELPENEVILIDAGSLTAPAAGRTTIAAFLRSRGIRRIDEIIVSHPNLDHYGGIPEVIDEIEVERITVTQQFIRHAETHRASRAFLDIVRAGRIPIETVAPPAEDRRSNVVIEHLWPPPGAEGLTANDSSLVTRVSIGDSSILFTGDVEQEAITKLLENGLAESNVLALPHHGQVVRSTAALLTATDADVLVRSSNQRREDTTNGLFLLADKRPLLSTADVGAVCVTLTPSDVRAAPCEGR